MAQLSAEVQARVAEEDEALLAVEAQLPGGEDEIHWSELESDSSENVVSSVAEVAGAAVGAGAGVTAS